MKRTKSLITILCVLALMLGLASVCATTAYAETPETDYVSATADVALTVTHDHDFGTTDVCACGAVKISALTFPSEEFRAWISENIAGADDGILTVEELAAVTIIEMQGVTVYSIKGIEYFTSLTHLNCTMTGLSELDVSKNTALEFLYCGSNFTITELDLSKNTALIGLNCGRNDLSVLDLSNNPELTRLDCSNNNNIVSLDLQNNLKLDAVFCQNCSITSLDVSKNTVLDALYCQNNELTSLIVDPALTILDCSKNALTHLDLSANNNFSHFVGDGQKLDITIGDDAQFALPNAADRVTSVSGATADGDALKGIFGNEVVYTYNTGLADMNLTVTLNVTDPHEHTQIGYCVCGGVAINDINFPDDIFRNAVIEKASADEDLFLTADELGALTLLAVRNMGISDLTGIAYFTNLISLSCDQNNLTELDISKNTQLKTLYCYKNKLTELDVSHNVNLATISCYENELTALDLSNNLQLSALYCSNNFILSLDLSKNTRITSSFNLSGQKANITITDDDRYTLPADLSAANVISVSGAVLDGNVLKNIFGDTVFYEYATGLEGKVLSVILNVTNPHGHDFNTTDVCACGTVKISALTFPSEQFRTWISEKIAGADDGIMTVEELAAVTSIEMPDIKVYSIKGIEYFTSLIYLNCTRTGLSELDVSKNTKLYSLLCSSNSLSTLDISNNTALDYLKCNYNSLSALDLSNNSELRVLECYGNEKLAVLDLSNNPKLYNINCSDCSITSLDASQSSTLEYLRCQDNKLTSLALNPQLVYLDCSNNALTHLDLSANSNLTTFIGDGQTADITIGDDSQFALPNAAGRVTSVSGAVADGNALKGIFGNEVVYTYNTGLADMNLSVTLTVSNPHEHAQIGACPCGGVAVNDTNFPDPEFLSYVQNKIYGANDGFLTEQELAAVVKITVTAERIASLKGIEYFTALKELLCAMNNLTSLDISKNTELTILNCYSNQLTYLDVSNNTKLLSLLCNNNKLLTIDLSANTSIRTADLGGQKGNITIGENAWCTLPSGIDASKVTVKSGAVLDGNVLKDILGDTVVYEYATGLAGKALTVTLTVDNPHTHTDTGLCLCGGVVVNRNNFPDENLCNTLLKWVDDGADGFFSSAELANKRGFDVMDKGISNLQGIEYFTAVEVLYCYGNQLTSIDLSKNTALTMLVCYNNQLTSLDLSANTALTILNCKNNQLTSLDLSANTELTDLNCDNNHLTSIDLSANTALNLFSGADQTATVSLLNNSFDMARLDKKFDASKVVSIDSVASFNGNALVLSQDCASVEYSYSTGNGRNALGVTLTIEYADYSALIDELEEKLDQAVKELNEAIATRVSPEQLADAVADLTAKYIEADEALKLLLQAEIDADVAELKNALEAADKVINDTIAELTQKLNDAITDLNNKIATGDAGLQEQITELDKAYKLAIEALELALQAEIDADVAELKNALEAADKVINDTIAELTQKLNEAKTELSDAIAQNKSDLTAEINRLEEAYLAADLAINGHIADLKAEDIAIKEKLTALEGALAGVKSELMAAIDKVAKDLADAKSDLSDAIADGDRELSGKISALDRAYKAADELINSSIAALKTEDTAIKESIEALKGTLESTKTELQAAIDKVVKDLETAKSELNTAIANGDRALEEKLAELEKAFKAADAIINSDIAGLKAEDESLNAALAELKSSLADAEAELRASIDRVAKDLADTKTELDDKLTVIIIVMSVIGAISVGSAVAIVVAFIKKRKI